MTTQSFLCIGWVAAVAAIVGSASAAAASGGAIFSQRKGGRRATAAAAAAAAAAAFAPTVVVTGRGEGTGAGAGDMLGRFRLTTTTTTTTTTAMTSSTVPRVPFSVVRPRRHSAPSHVRLHASSSSSSSSSSSFSGASGKREKTQQAGPRAGSEGYSILRRPLDWDVDSDPTFDVPSDRDGDGDNGTNVGRMRTGDEEWFGRRTIMAQRRRRGGLFDHDDHDDDDNDNGNGNGNVQTRRRHVGNRDTRGTSNMVTTPTNANQFKSRHLLQHGTTQSPQHVHSPKRSETHRRNDESVQTIDLTRRTLDALDYPSVLAALKEECDTVPAKVIVDRELASGLELLKSKQRRGQKQGQGMNKIESRPQNQADDEKVKGNVSTELQQGKEIVYDTIASENVADSKHVADNDGDGDGDGDDYDDDPDADMLTMALTSSSAKGARKRYRAVMEMKRLVLAYDGRNKILKPPPMGGLSFDLNPIFESTDRGKVLDGPDILEVATTLETLEQLKLWGDGLASYGDGKDKDGKREKRKGNKNDYNNDEFQVNDETTFVELPRLTSQISIDPTLLSLLTEAFDDTGRLSGDTFPNIGRLRSKVRTLKRSVLSLLDTILVSPSISTKLSLESGGPPYSEVNGRIVIPINQKYGNSVGIVHDVSRSRKTSYVEPTELIGPTNELRSVESELRTEEAKVWRRLTESILARRVEIDRGVMVAAHIDLVVARMKLGERMGGTVPLVGDDGIISLGEARHPVLLLRELDDVVPNDVSIGIGSNRGLVLTGPNSGGKTIILKLLGLVALMARDGIPIPASSCAPPMQSSSSSSSLSFGKMAAGGELEVNYGEEEEKEEEADAYRRRPPRVDFFDPVLADIGDLQSVDGDLSTFSGHMLVCKNVLERTSYASLSLSSSPSSSLSNKPPSTPLVLMDEVGSGTDPAQGVAIAQALLEALLDTGRTRVAITTHYVRLKQLASSDERFAVGGMQFVNGRPTYRYQPGVVGESFALAVAERMDLPQSVLARANELLDSETRKMGELLRDLEEQKLAVELRLQELDEKRIEMERMELELKGQRNKLEQKQLVARREEARKFATKLEEKERILEDILERLKSDPSKKVIARSWDDVRFVRRDALSEAENVPSVLRRRQDAARAADEANADLVPLTELRDRPDINVGDVLVVCKAGSSMRGKEVKVVKVGNKIEVAVGNMPVRFKMSELALPPTSDRGVGVRVGAGAGAAFNSNRMIGPNGEVLSKEARRAMAGGGEEVMSPAHVMDFEDNFGGGGGGGGRRGGGGGTGMRLDSNTVDVRGCTFEEARDKCRDMFGRVMTRKDPVVYVLHGHGTGALRNKIRNWLAKDRTWVKKWSKADDEDGGDALTRVEVKNMQF